MASVMNTRPFPSLALTVCFAASISPVFANGGGYYRGGVERTGTVTGFEPSGTEHIRILDEQLNVWLSPEQAEVEVRYIMRNTSKKRVKVRFGFPVEELFDEGLSDEKAARPKKKLEYCRDYRVAAGGKPLKATFETEHEKNDKRFKGLAGWLVSKITFQPGEEKPVTISFVSVYPIRDDFVSEDASFSARIFRYRLSTGACWAGTIASGRVTLRPKGIDPAELRVIKPVNRFHKNKDDSWVWEFENLEPTLADDIEVEAVPKFSSYGYRLRLGAKKDESRDVKNRADYIHRRGRWLMEHRNYTATASSTLPPDKNNRYDVGNLNDDDWQNAWAEGAPGPGRGEWIKIRPEVPKPLAAIKLRSGYSKSKELFFANARPKTVKVELNGEYSFTAELPKPIEREWRHWHRIPVHGYNKPVKTVKLTFEDVWKGTRYDDLCISGLDLVVELDKKPKFSGCR